MTERPHPLHRAPAAGAAQPARRAQGRHRRRARRGQPGLARGVPARRRRGRRDRHRPRRPQHQRRLRLHPPRPAQGRRGARTAPTSASPTTATPTAAWPSTPRAPRSTATRSWASSPSRCKERGRARAGHPRRDRHEQPRAAPSRWSARGSRCCRPLSATATCSRRCAPGATRSAASSPGHVIMLDHGTTGDGVLTGLHAGRAGRRDRPQHRRPRRGDDPAAAGARQRPGRRQEPGRERRAPAVGGAPTSEAALDGSGRVLLRKSGTEPLVRVMVEAPTQEQADAVATASPVSCGSACSPLNPVPCGIGGLQGRDDVAGDLERGRRRR